MDDFASRLCRAPRPFDTDLAAEARAAAGWADPALRDLIAGTAGCSPYLAGLIAREAEWLEQAAEIGPEAAVEAELSALTGLSAEALGPKLREAKRRVALIAALADLGGVWPLETVTGSLTRLADAGLQAGLTALARAEIARGKLPGMTEADAETGAGMVVFAMGKMGAFELNYSSDIDLICLFDETRYGDDRHEARAVLVRITRRLAAMIGDITDQGYVFRTDLRLRPDASVTPVCLSMGAAEQYYESVGRTWERAAWIKARPCAGDIEAGEAFVRTLRPFIWRRHLDFNAIRDAHDMRLKIRDHKRLGGPLALPGHDMKLGRGGIREIEFFTQTRQLISGGRDASLRVRGTVEGLDRLAQAGWVPRDTADTLASQYRAHREVEHRLQMINDAQTHALPTSDEGFARLAAFMDRDVAVLRQELTERLEQVHALTEEFFSPGEAPPPADPGFGAEITARWPGYPALRSDRAVEIFDRLRPEILRALGQADRPEEALAQFDAFLAGLPAGVQLFSLFEANPQLTKLIVDICATSPGLAQYLSRNSGVFDAVIGGGFFADWPGTTALTAELAGHLARFPDHETRLDAARRWTKELHFRVGVHHLRGLIDSETAGREYAELAEAVVAALTPVVMAEMARRHGAAPGRGAVVLGMGSLGARRLSAASDLDLIVIYDADGQDASDGPRPLDARAWYARFTQSLITALSAPMAEGKLYEVDMRLRPSGRQGPVATALPAFRAYQLDEAWTWEHLALTRARPVAGDAALAEEVEAFRRELLAAKSSGATVLDDLAAMRARLSAARPEQGGWNLRDGPGRLQDVELFAQSLALRAGAPDRGVSDQIDAGCAAGLIDDDAAEALIRAAVLQRKVQSMARLLTGGPPLPESPGAGGTRFLLQETGFEDLAALQRALDVTAARAEAVIDAALAGASGGNAGDAG